MAEGWGNAQEQPGCWMFSRKRRTVFKWINQHGFEKKGGKERDDRFICDIDEGGGGSMGRGGGSRTRGGSERATGDF